MVNNFIGIQHTSFVISDVACSSQFYHNILGLPINRNRPDLSFDGLWLDINDHQQIHLLKVENPDSVIRPKNGGRDRHTAFKVNNLSLIQASLDKHRITYTLSKSGRQALFCRDPDGNTLEIME